MVIVAVPGDKRAHALAAAIARAGTIRATWLSWAEVLADPARVGAAGDPGDLLRVESPGADAATWHALARAGGLDRVVPDGEWRPGRAWFAGLGRALARIESAAPHLIATHPAAQILAMTDKLVGHQRVDAAGVPVPRGFEGPVTAGALRERLEAERLHAVYVKPRWGSSGAGVLAFRRAGAREQITTSISLRDRRFVNDKRLHRYEDRARIDEILGAVLADGAIVQRWIPKATAAGGPFDLRVLVVAGRIAQRVARVGRGTVTNLHLDAARAGADEILARFGARATARLEAACLAAAACFPGHHSVGVDVMLDRRGACFVLECNAWGDYLPGLWIDGLDSYDVQLRALPGGGATRRLDEAQG